MYSEKTIERDNANIPTCKKLLPHFETLFIPGSVLSKHYKGKVKPLQLLSKPTLDPFSSNHHCRANYILSNIEYCDRHLSVMQVGRR